jgi:hypothetical protein
LTFLQQFDIKIRIHHRDKKVQEAFRAKCYYNPRDLLERVI